MSTLSRLFSRRDNLSQLFIAIGEMDPDKVRYLIGEGAPVNSRLTTVGSSAWSAGESPLMKTLRMMQGYRDPRTPHYLLEQIANILIHAGARLGSDEKRKVRRWMGQSDNLVLAESQAAAKAVDTWFSRTFRTPEISTAPRPGAMRTPDAKETLAILVDYAVHLDEDVVRQLGGLWEERAIADYVLATYAKEQNLDVSAVSPDVLANEIAETQVLVPAARPARSRRP